MSVGKRLRFEIFKRDGFFCHYCGRKPPEVVLEVDHILPRSKGGSDEELNLITSCADCNRGKSNKLLDVTHPTPDAEMAYLEVQQEIAEAERYLALRDSRQKLQSAIQAQLQDVWMQSFNTGWALNDQQWKAWLNHFSPEEIEYAIKCAIKFHQRSPKPASSQLVKYVSGILWRRKQEG